MLRVGLLLVLTRAIQSVSRYSPPNADLFSSSFSRVHRQLASAPSGGPLPAQHYVMLESASDDLHHHVVMYMNGQPLKLLLDTGSSDMLVLDHEWCKDLPTHGQCYVYSSTQNATNVPTYFQVTLDNEEITDYDPKKLRGILEMDTLVVGTNVMQNFSAIVDSFFSSGLQYEQVLAPQRALHQFPDSDGLLGLAYSRLANPAIGSPPFQLILRDLSDAPTLPVFSLDLNGPDRTSWMWLGGIQEEYRDRLVWGAQIPPVNWYHQVPIVQMEVCGVDLFQNYSDRTFLAIVDSGSSCLGLPAEIFDMLITWLPIKCAYRTFASTKASDIVCWLPPGVNVTFPTLTFRMEAGGDPVYIPLGDLILPDREFCLRRGFSLDVAVDATIGIGNRALRSLYTVFYMPTRQVAFAAKDKKMKSSNVQCQPRLQCKGMQTSYDGYNVCVDPVCSDYYFYEFDNVNKVCYMSSIFHFIGGSLLVLYVGLEIFLNEIQAYLDRKVISSFRLTPLP